MKKTWLRTAMVLGVATLVGCSGSDVSEVAAVTGVDTLAATSITPAPTITPESAAAIDSSPTAASTEIEPFRNPFAPPTDPPPPPVVEEPEPEPEPEPVPESEPTPGARPVRTPPTVRLLGFMNVGEPKVLVSFNDELKALAIGDTLEDMKVVKIESPELTMLFDERDIKLRLFDQAWQYEGGGSLVDSSSRSHTRSRPTRSVQTTSSSPFNSTPVGAPVGAPTGAPTGGTVGGIPGFGPSHGQPPGDQPPGASGFGSTPGGAGGGLPGLPGLPGGGLPGGGGGLPGGGGGLPGGSVGGGLPGAP